MYFLWFFLVLLFPLLNPASGWAYEISARFPETRELSGAQFKDLANEWAFIASAPMIGPTRDLPAWRPWADLSYITRSVRLAPGSNQGSLNASQYSWISNPAFAREADPSVRLPFAHVGLSLPGGPHVGFIYGRSPNVNLQVMGGDVSYPFLRPSLTSPGLWARISYIRPTLVPGLKMHMPAAGLYLTNEFMRTPFYTRPLTAHLHAGVQQMLVLVAPQGLYETRGTGSNETQVRRESIVFPASTQFLLGLEFVWRGWSTHANLAYASSETNFDAETADVNSGTKRIRAFWTQSYKISYRLE